MIITVNCIDVVVVGMFTHHVTVFLTYFDQLYSFRWSIDYAMTQQLVSDQLTIMNMCLNLNSWLIFFFLL